MRALLLNGAAEGDALTDAAAEALASELAGLGWDVRSVLLRDKRIAACRGCFGCWIRTPGECVIRDDQADLLAEFVASDAVAYVTPVTFGGYSSTMKSFVDRVIPVIDPRFMNVRGEFHHRMRYDAYPTLLGFGTLPAPDADAEATFRQLLYRNSINNHSAAYAEVVAGEADPSAVRQTAARLAHAVTQEVAA